MIGRLFLGVVALTAGCEHGSGDAVVPTRAATCGECHSAQYQAWEQSSHALGGSPVFHALTAEVARAWGKSAADACTSCHQPGHGDDAGIGCVACHGAVGNRGESDGRLVVDLTRPIAAADCDTPNPAHDTRCSELLTSESLCGTCHEVTGPNLFVEPTLTQFRDSIAPALGLTCAGCHMDGHRFIGLDPPWGASQEVRAEAAQRSRDLLAEAVTLRVRVEGDQVRITAVSTCVGHNVPTGVAMLRRLQVTVVAVDAAGQLIAEDPVALQLADQPTREGVPVALPTHADAVQHNALQPGEQRTYTLDIPAWAPRPVHVTATLVGGAFRPEVLTALGLDELADQVPELLVRQVKTVVP